MMSRKLFFAAAITWLFVTCPQTSYGWGAWGHNHITKGAILALPAEMRMFFYNHADFMIEESTVPDIRRAVMGDKSEGPRHYINLEKYGYLNEALPRTEEEAVARYGRNEVNEYGTLPWHVQDMMKKLTAAFKKGNRTEILFLAADLGHYVADAHVPLHTTVNHDGQITGQQGIHALWESQLPELFGKEYKLYVAEPRYLKNPEKAIWDVIDSSYSLVSKILVPEHRMKLDNPQDKQYLMGPDGAPQKNKYGQPIHQYVYAHVYHELLNGMVERQMRKAIQFTASCWYTAWVNAGRPDMSDWVSETVTEANAATYTADMKAYKNGKIRGCHSQKEFPSVAPAAK
jgi:hypothetical protein